MIRQIHFFQDRVEPRIAGEVQVPAAGFVKEIQALDIDFGDTYYQSECQIP